MRRTEQSTRVHYKGSSEDFVIFAESPEQVKKWRNDKTLPLAEVLNGFHIFTTRHHGSQGMLDKASNSALENEFGTKNQDDVVKRILESGEVKEQKAREREGNTNLSNGTLGCFT
ncbi:ribosome maturation protein [Kalaharituber pfeilii]|nr:ribosome maturation protein [Kalaharituber pfeilii]